MNQAAVKQEESKVIYPQWRFSEKAQSAPRDERPDEKEEIERLRQKMKEEKRELERERRELERLKQEFSIEKRAEDRRIETERHLFEMKWKILEEEVKKLAVEKQQFEKQRSFYRYVSAHEKADRSAAEPHTAARALFFVGVASEQALKKRYKDLIKIYHPDNLGGDTKMLQEINRQYDRLKQKY